MPELPEVQTVVDTLNAAGITGRRIHAVAHVRRDMVSPSDCDLSRRLPGRSIESVARRGKRILLRFGDANRMFIHLGMTGRLTVEPRATPLRPHTHLIVRLDDEREIRFVDPRRFGAIVWLGDCADNDAGIGPEPLLMRSRDLGLRLAATRRAIKTALLDQRLLAGIGNIYADEALFSAGIHPQLPSRELTATQVRRLCASIKRVLKRAIRHRGSTLRDYIDANGQPGGFQAMHRVYDRAGQPCPRCRTPIARIVVGGRSTHYCPSCQNSID